MKSHIQLGADADIDHMEAVATAYSSQIGMRLCSLSIGGRKLFPRLHEVLYTHFKNVHNFAIHSRPSAHLGDAYLPPDRASQLMWTARCLAASANRWPEHADFDLDDVRALFERGQQLGGSIEQAATWAEVVAALEPAPAQMEPESEVASASDAAEPGFDWKLKREQLRRIEKAAQQHSATPDKGPPDTAAVVCANAVAAFFMCLIAADGLSWLGFTRSLPWPWLLLTAASSYIAILALWPSSRSYGDVVYAKLAAYAPIDKGGYRALQVKARGNGCIELHDVQNWASGERHAIALVAGRTTTKATAAFLEKAV